MNLHALTFEQILRLCSSLEDPNEIAKLIQALEILERNIRYRRQELSGMLNGLEIRDERERQEQRRAVKNSLRVVRTNTEEDGSEKERT
jgi:hypothetical protein